jgi:hypothetical protein
MEAGSKLNRWCVTSLHGVLSIVSCAKYYGHTNQIVMGFFAELIDEHLSDEEIEAYVADEFLSDAGREQGYSEEDADESRERLREFRDKWCGKEPA